ncbi:hypothetical protein ABBQ32_010311 [Trebouxia sp. C0010 RCD-2024]
MPCRLASGDTEGRVLVWDVSSGTVIASLEDPLAAAQTPGPIARRPEPGKGGAVRGLAWIMSNPCVLAIVLASGMFLVWDMQAASVLWRKDFGLDHALTTIKVDPTDWRHLCLCGSKGSIIVLRLVNLGRDKVEQQSYKVDMSSSKPGDTLRCCFSTTRDLLYVLLPREVVVFDLEFGQPAASSSLPASRPPFRDILGCFGHQAIGKDVTEGGIDLLCCCHQEGSLSMWRRQPGQLNYTIISLHKLVPPPSRISNNATVNILCLAASLWLRCNTDPSRNTLVTPLHHTTTSFGPLAPATSGKNTGPAPGAASNSPGKNQRAAAAEADDSNPRSSPDSRTQPSGNDSSAAESTARLSVKTEVTNASIGSRSPVSVLPSMPNPSQDQKEDHESLLVMTVSDDGHVWQWNVPLHGFLPPPKAPTPTSAPSQPPPAKAAAPGQLPAALAKPALLGLLHTLPHSVTTFSVCPVPVGAGWAGDLNQPSGQSGEGGDAVAVLAAVTSAGNVELITLQRGSLTPLSSTISVSLGAHKDVVRGVRWLGPTARIVSFSSEKTAHGYRNTLLLTDIRNRSSLAFREVGAEGAPMVGIRASPLGRYILVLLRGAPSEIWAIGGSTRPARVRVLDLPFTAVEWLLPSDMLASGGDPLTPAKWMVWDRSPLAKERSLTGYFTEQDEGSTPHTPMDPSEQPEEKLSFALGNGSVGILAVKGRKVTDCKPKKPNWGMRSSGEVHSTTIAAWGHLVLLGDADGNLNKWDTTTGRVTSIATGQGAVRRMHFAPPTCTHLDHVAGSLTSPSLNARVCCLFVNGAFGVWELDSRNELRAGPVTVASSLRVGRVIDLSWAPLPQPVGGGAVVALALEDGSLAFVDTSQAVESSSRKQRMQAFKHLLGGSWPYPQPLGSSLLLPRPWALLLRLLLQQGVPEYLLHQLTQPSLGDESALESAVWALFPEECQKAWHAAPHRMGTAEAQELTYWAEGSPEHQLRRNTLDAIPSLYEDAFNDPGDGWEGSGALGHAVTSPGDSLGPSPMSSPGQPPVSPGDPAHILHGASPGPSQKDSGKASEDGSSIFSVKGISRRLALGPSRGKDDFARSLPPASSSGTIPAKGPGADMVALTPRHTYNASLGLVLRALAHMRAGGALLHAAEWRMYSKALHSNCICQRMAVVATVSGNSEEASCISAQDPLANFWRHLPATLASLKATLAKVRGGVKPHTPATPQEVQEGVSAAFTRPLAVDATQQGEPQISQAALRPDANQSLGGAGQAAAGPRTLWSEAAELAEARERSQWHELMSRRNTEPSEKLQERRVIEYVALGDFATAVGFLLASTPEKSARYYRDALCTLALAAATNEQHSSGSSSSLAADSVSKTLHIQAAKVVAAHAASVGDNLLGVPLLCSAGLPQEAVIVLQEAQLWRYAATLTANTLTGSDRAITLERWAAHIHQAEGSLWRGLGMLVAGGGLRSAVLLLRKVGMPDCAQALAQAVADAQLDSKQGSADAGYAENLFHHTGNTPARRMSFGDKAHSNAAGQSDANSVQAECLQFVCNLMQQL